MQVVRTDVVVVGGGGSGLRAAIAATESDPRLKVALVSKVVPMRSHTVAAEGGSAGVIRSDDSLDNHFDDTVGGGDWLCDQDVVEYFVAHCTEQMTQLEHWGCPWSRKDDGNVNVRFFGGRCSARGSPRTRPAFTCCTRCSRPRSSTPRSSATTSFSAP